jgi:putative aminopeptidase FrvX
MLYDGSLVPNPVLRDFVADVAREEGIPHQFDSLAQGGTDGGRMQLVDGGVPTLALCIPTRYMHSHNIMVHHDDIVGASRLVAALVRRLDARVVDAIQRRDPAALTL